MVRPQWKKGSRPLLSRKAFSKSIRDHQKSMLLNSKRFFGTFHGGKTRRSVGTRISRGSTGTHGPRGALTSAAAALLAVVFRVFFPRESGQGWLRRASYVLAFVRDGLAPQAGEFLLALKTLRRRGVVRGGPPWLEGVRGGGGLAPNRSFHFRMGSAPSCSS